MKPMNDCPTEENIPIKDCPFCTQPAIAFETTKPGDTGNVWYVGCSGCRMSTPRCYSKSEAMTIWNRRPQNIPMEPTEGAMPMPSIFELEIITSQRSGECKGCLWHPDVCKHCVQSLSAGNCDRQT